MPYNESAADELARIKQYHNDRARQDSYAAAATPDLAARTASIGSAYPQIPPKTTYALAATGNAADSPLVSEVAARNHNKKGFWGGGFGSVMGRVARTGIRAGMVGLESPFQLVSGAWRDVASFGGAAGRIAAGAIAGAGTGATAAGIAGGTLGSIVPGLGNIVGAIGGVTGGAIIGGIAGGIGGAVSKPVEGGFVNPLAQTSLGQVASQAMSGEGIDMGEGYFAGGVVREEQVKKARAAASINGSGLTGGRLLANGLLHPGSTPYNFVSGLIDATLIMKYDPTLIAGKEVKALRETRKLLRPTAEGLGPIGRRLVQAKAAGRSIEEVDEASQMGRRLSLINANAPAVDAEYAAEAILREKDVVTWSEKMAGESDAFKIWNDSGRKFTIETANQIADANSGADVLGIARDAILKEGLNERRALETGGRISQTFSPIRNSRVMSILPHGGIDLRGMEDENGWKLGRAVAKWDNFLKNTGIDDELRNEQVNKLMRAKSVPEAQAVVNEGVAAHVSDHLLTLGWEHADVDEAIGSYAAIRKELHQKAWTELSEDGEIAGVVIDGKPTPIARASAVSEYAEHVIELPDVTEIRRMAQLDTKLGKLYNNDLWKSSIKTLDRVMYHAWRPLVLLRPAWAIRMVGEESARLIAAGYSAPGFNPISMIAMMISPEARNANALAAAGDVLGMDDAFKASMTDMTTLKGDAGMFSKHKAVYTPQHAQYGQALAGNLVELHVDDLSRTIVDDGLDAARQWWWEGEGKSLRESHSIKNGRPLTKAESDQQVFMQHDRIKTVTGNEPRLLHAVSQGYLPKEGYAMDAVANSFTDIEQRAHDLATEAADKAADRAVRQASSARAKKVAEEMEAKVAAAPAKTKRSAAETAADRAAKKAARAKADELMPGVATKTKAARARAGLTAEESDAVDKIANVLKHHGFDSETAVLAKDSGNMAAQIAGVEYKVNMQKHIIKALGKGGPKALTVEQEAMLKVVRQQAYNAARDEARNAIYKELGTTPGVATEGLPKFIETGERGRISLRRTDGKGIIDDEAAAMLQEMGVAGEGKLPREVKGAREVTGEYKGVMGKLKQRMFNAFMAVPLNHLTRSPVFNQEYWIEINKAVPLMDEAARAQTLATLRKGTGAEAERITNRIDELSDFLLSESDDALKSAAAEEMHELQVLMADKGVAKVTPALRESLERQLARPGGGVMTMEQAEMVARGRALERVEQLLDNSNEHRAFDHALRNIAPFGHAWRQATAKWAKVLYEDPTAVRKFQRVITAGGMSSGLDSSMSLDFVKQEAISRGVEIDDNMTKEEVIAAVNVSGHNGGFFYKDDHGKWVFNYPAGELFTQMATGEGINPIHRFQTGVPTPLQASAGGLSMMTTQIVPGAGPMVSIAASKIIPMKPEWDGMRNLLAPYGDPTAEGYIKGFMPPWMKRLQQAFADPNMDRLQGNTVGDVMKYLVSTGEYNTNSPEAQKELLDEATSRAKWLTGLRAAAQLFVPSSPTPIAVAHVQGPNDDGRTMVAQSLIQDLQKMQREDYDTATAKFLDKYGDQALLYLQSNTRPIKGNLPETDKGFDFARSNPDLVRDHPNVYGFFAPPDGKFEYAAYIRSLRTGEREQLTPKQVVELANDRVASMIYYTLKDGLGPKLNDDQRQTLGAIKQQLATMYPGFNRAGEGLTGRATNEVMIKDITEAVKNEKIAATPVGAAVKNYLTLREAAMIGAQKRGVKGFATSAKTADIRKVMRSYADILSNQTPGFNLVYDRVFDQEMKNDAGEENV